MPRGGFGRSRGCEFSPVRLAQQPAEVGPGSPRHDSPHREGDPLRQRSHQPLHLLHHGSGIGAVWEQGHIEGGPAWRQGSLRILLLNQGQEPAENQRHWSCRALLAFFSFPGLHHCAGNCQDLLSLYDIRAEVES